MPNGRVRLRLVGIQMAGPSLEGLLNPDVLGWVRRSSNLDVESVAKRIGVESERVTAWEQGTAYPTLAQLRKLAHLYRRSLGVFLLADRPPEKPQPADFRRMELSAHHIISPELANGIRAAEWKREAVLDIFTQSDEDPPGFSVRVDPALPPEDAALALAAQMRITMNDRRSWANEYDALNAWKEAVERLGVLVMQLSGVAVSEMRGCSLALFPLPIILLNSSDRPLGRVFTLIHELTHLARSESGLCDVFDDLGRTDKDEAIETYCNHVAGAVLVPLDDLLRQPDVARIREARAWGGDELSGLRRMFWASREAILRRLLIAGKTTRQFYQAERARLRQLQAQDEGESSSGFVAFPRRVVLANGRLLTAIAINAYESSVITGSELSQILGAKLDHLPSIVEVLRSRAAA